MVLGCLVSAASLSCCASETKCFCYAEKGVTVACLLKDRWVPCLKDTLVEIGFVLNAVCSSTSVDTTGTGTTGSSSRGSGVLLSCLVCSMSRS
jgi:hypothetical protein